MPAFEPFFLDRTSILTPPGLQHQVRQAARHAGQTASEFVRSAIRDGLRTVAAKQPAAGD